MQSISHSHQPSNQNHGKDINRSTWHGNQNQLLRISASGDRVICLGISSSSSSSINSSKIAPRSPVVASSKQLFTTMSNKAMIPFKSKKKLDETSGFNECVLKDMGLDDGEEGLWQRSILMGEKCQPPEFSGVIYYDSNGKQLPELPPKSPRVVLCLSLLFQPHKQIE